MHLGICHMVGYTPIFPPQDIGPGIPPPPDWNLRYSPTPLLLTFSGDHWRPVQTYSFQDNHPSHIDTGDHRNTDSWQAGKC